MKQLVLNPPINKSNNDYFLHLLEMETPFFLDQPTKNVSKDFLESFMIFLQRKNDLARFFNCVTFITEPRKI